MLGQAEGEGRKGGGLWRGRAVEGPCDGREGDAVWSLEAGQHNVVMPAKAEGEALLQGLREGRDVSGDSFIAAASASNGGEADAVWSLEASQQDVIVLAKGEGYGRVWGRL